MYKHILVPTDGSRLAGKAIKQAMSLAKQLRARVTAVYVSPPFAPPMYSEAAVHYTGAFSARKYRELCEKLARKHLAVAERAARAAGIPCKTRSVTASRPWQGILQAARAGRCDVVVMASHGRGALGGLLLGNETQRVLAHSRIPVLVVR